MEPTYVCTCVCVYRERESVYKELAYIIMKAEKSRLRRAGTALQSKMEAKGMRRLVLQAEDSHERFFFPSGLQWIGWSLLSTKL